MRRIGIVSDIARAGLLGAFAASFTSSGPLHSSREGPGVRNHLKRSGSISLLNRNTGKPHEHKREIARRQRQAARGVLA